jgi:hypothetical protein
MEEIKAPKKERKFLKAIVRVAGVLVQELALGLGRKYIGKMINKIKIPKKRETLSFLLLLSCTFAFAQYPATGNKQRLGYQTTGDGLVFRGRSNDTTALKPSSLNNAYHLFDTVNNVLFSYIKTKGGWKFNNADTVIVNNVTDTTSLSNRINLKINISDTASMLTNYLRTGVAAATYQTKLTNPITGSGSTSYVPFFTSSSNIAPGLLYWNNGVSPNRFFTSDYDKNILTNNVEIGGTLVVTGAITGSSGITIVNKSSFGNVGVGGDSMIVNGFLKLNNRYPSATAINRIVAFNTDNSVLGELNLSNLFNVVNSGAGAVTQTLNIKSASTTQVGVIDTSSQSFFGNKTFTSNITLENDVDNRSGYLRRGYVTVTNATYTVADNVTWIICNRSGGTITLTLPNALSNDGRELHIKNITTNSVISNASNVVELADNAATTNILAASKDGGWATLVSNGSNWVIMQAN